MGGSSPRQKEGGDPQGGHTDDNLTLRTVMGGQRAVGESLAGASGSLEEERQPAGILGDRGGDLLKTGPLAVIELPPHLFRGLLEDAVIVGQLGPINELPDRQFQSWTGRRENSAKVHS